MNKVFVEENGVYQIVVVDKGRIVQRGNHDQLMKEDGIYKRFVDARKKAVSWKLEGSL